MPDADDEIEAVRLLAADMESFNAKLLKLRDTVKELHSQFPGAGKELFAGWDIALRKIEVGSEAIAGTAKEIRRHFQRQIFTP